MKAAVPIAQVGEGEMAACEVDGVKVLVCQVEGQFYALHDQCSHARQALHAGTLVGHQVRCPLHGGRFNVRTGACEGPPAILPVSDIPPGARAWQSARRRFGVGGASAAAVRPARLMRTTH